MTYRTKTEISMTWRRRNAEYAIVIPKGTRCRKITEGSTAGRFWVDDLSWIDGKADGFLKHDATHYGIDLDPEQVEQV